MTNLEESIICKLDDKICYTNIKGEKIVNYARALIKSSDKSISKESEIKDDTVPDQKIFHVFNDRIPNDQDKEANDGPLSIGDLYLMDPSLLE